MPGIVLRTGKVKGTRLIKFPAFIDLMSIHKAFYNLGFVDYKVLPNYKRKHLLSIYL